MIFDGYCIPGTERDTFLPVENLLREMDASGIEKAVIAPEDRELVVANEAGNDRMLRIAGQHAARLVPACCANPWRGADADAELNRSVGRGARMLILAPALQGFVPTDEMCDPLLQRAAQLDVPVYFHSGPHGSGGPTQMLLVAEKHPRTRFILGHCGATDHAWDMPTILKHHCLENVWFELSFVRPWAAMSYVETVGPGRFIWGSSSPRNSPGFELAHLGANLPLDRYPDIFGGNLARLLTE